MALLDVRLYGDPILRRKAMHVQEVTPELRRLISDMVETMFHQVGIGLAAPQVGIPYRLLVMDDGKGGARALVNPVITQRSGSVVDEEGCLSLPGIYADVERSKSVTIEATDEDEQPINIEATGMQARVIQHEMDHLDGILFIDHLSPVARDRIKQKIQKHGFPKERRSRAFAL
ncbi:MAG TPA: peptide deformylase [Methylomirabilota bacterium]|nr:peptide deformylase [Methylomirabilota bacterium]